VLEWLLLVALSLLWGGSFFFTAVALGALPPLTFVLGRVGGAAAALLLVITVSGQRLPRALGPWAPSW
jgi:drug/metabolite transporter (DMT)-like permease